MMLPRTDTRFWRAAFLACALAVLVLATLPLQQMPLPDTGWDKTNHLAAFLVLGLLGQRAWPGAPVACCLGLLGYGAAIELLQSALPYRAAEWADLVADAAGLMLALALSTLGRRPQP